MRELSSALAGSHAYRAEMITKRHLMVRYPGALSFVDRHNWLVGGCLVPGLGFILAVILAGVAVKLLVADLYTFPTWASPAFITAVLAVVTLVSVRDRRRHPGGNRPSAPPRVRMKEHART